MPFVGPRRRNFCSIVAVVAVASSVSSTSLAAEALRPPPPKSRRPTNRPQSSSPQSIKSKAPRTKNINPSTYNSATLPISLPSLETQLCYARNGHAVLRQVLPPRTIQKVRREVLDHAQNQELAAWKQKITVAADYPTAADSCHTIEACQAKLIQLLGPEAAADLPFLQFFHTRKACPTVWQVIYDLAETAAHLLFDTSHDQDCAVRLYQDALFWKRTADGPTPWHADARMAPFDTNEMVTLWIPLQTVPADGGTALVFCSQSHADFSLPYWHGSPDQQQGMNHPRSGSAWDYLEERYPDDTHLVDYMPLTVGDLTAHAGWTLHCANGNSSSKQKSVGDRLALAITYVDAKAPIRKLRKSESGAAAGDNEDVWSYKDWLNKVPSGVRGGWDHQLVPIVWKNKTSRNNSTQKKKR